MRTAIPKENGKKKKNDVGSHETKLLKEKRQQLHLVPDTDGKLWHPGGKPVY